MKLPIKQAAKFLAQHVLGGALQAAGQKIGEALGERIGERLNPEKPEKPKAEEKKPDAVP